MIDFDGIEKLMEDEMRRCLTTAYEAPIDSDVHKSAIESAIELYKATEKKLDNDGKRAGEQLKTETSGQQEENKLKFEKKKHADFVRNERERIKNERDKNIIDSCIFVGKAAFFFILGSAAYNADNGYKIINKTIVQTLGKIIG